MFFTLSHTAVHYAFQESKFVQTSQYGHDYNLITDILTVSRPQITISIGLVEVCVEYIHIV